MGIRTHFHPIHPPEGAPLHFVVPAGRVVTINFTQAVEAPQPQEPGANPSLWERFKAAFRRVDAVIETGVRALGYPLKYAGVAVMLGGTAYMLFILLSTLSLAAVISSGGFLLLLAGAILYQFGKDLSNNNDSSNVIGSGMYLPLPFQFRA